MQLCDDPQQAVHCLFLEFMVQGLGLNHNPQPASFRGRLCFRVLSLLHNVQGHTVL